MFLFSRSVEKNYLKSFIIKFDSKIEILDLPEKKSPSINNCFMIKFDNIYNIYCSCFSHAILLIKKNKDINNNNLSNREKKNSP